MSLRVSSPSAASTAEGETANVVGAVQTWKLGEVPTRIAERCSAMSMRNRPIPLVHVAAGFALVPSLP